jgi:hypothetical protein
MPYYHKYCGGKISWVPPLPVPPRCNDCGKIWNPLVVYGPRPKDMEYRLEREPATYARWADKLPGAGSIASHLPNWPRWARITSFALLVGVLSVIIYLVFGR